MRNNSLHPEVYALSVTLTLDHNYRALLTDFLAKVADRLEERGYPLVGHIKLAAQNAAGGVFYASIVDKTTGPQCQGGLNELQRPATLKINAILYQVEKGVIQEIIDAELKSLR